MQTTIRSPAACILALITFYALFALLASPFCSSTQRSYTSVAGELELREAVCTYLRRARGATYTAPEVVISSGAKQSLYQVKTEPESLTIANHK